MIMIYDWDKKLKKILYVPDAVMITKNHWLNVSSSKDAFLPDVFQMTAITLVSVINHFHINGLRLFWDTAYRPENHFLMFYAA